MLTWICQRFVVWDIGRMCKICCGLRLKMVLAKLGLVSSKRHDKHVACSVNRESFGCEVNSAQGGKGSLHSAGTNFQNARLKVAGHGI